MSGFDRARRARWTPAAANLVDAAPRRATTPTRLVSDDVAEVEADRVAGSIGTLATVPVRAARPVSVQRQSAPPAGSQAAIDAAAKAQVDAEIKRVLKAGLDEAIKVEPLASLVAQGREALASAAGKIALAEVIASVIAASALAHRPLPITSWTQDLGDLTSALRGATVKLTWEGPADEPTKAGVQLTYAPASGPLQGVSVTGAVQGGSATPTGGAGAVRYAPPGGPLRGASVSVGASGGAGQPLRGQIDVGYTAPGGVLRGAEARLSGSVDTAGAAGVGVSLTVPIGSSGTRRRSRASDDLSRETERLRAANRAMAELGKTDAERREEEEMMRAWLASRANPATFGGVRRAADAGSVAEHPDIARPRVDAAISEPGSPLPSAVRSTMEDALGHDFSHVRVHSGDRATASARSLGALAYTIGSDVVFRADQWEPTSPAGQRLLAHELTHVVQQERSGSAHP